MNKNGEIEIFESSIKKVMKEKLGEFISLDIDKVQISEFNTRFQFLDEIHVKTLIKSIEQHGYIPKAAVWINAIMGMDNEIISYRLVAGRHRYEAAKKVGLKFIPAQLYYNLTDEEECEMDRLDNELDEHHKPANFLQIAEHYMYLYMIKKWSLRKIADVKNVSKSDVDRKLNIAKLPDEIKQIIRGCPHVGTLQESYFREICQLTSIPYQKRVLEEIISKNLDANKKVSGSKRYQNSSSYTERITQADVKSWVEELLELERQEKAEQELLSVAEDTPDFTSFSSQKIDKKQNSSKDLFSCPSGNISDKEKGAKNSPEAADNKSNPSNPSPSGRKKKNKDIPGQIMFEIFSEVSDFRAAMTKPREFRFCVLPMWVRHTDLKKTLRSSAYYLLQDLISYDFRYRPDKDKFFFIKYGKDYENCLEFLAHLAGVGQNTLEKKVLPAIQEFVYYKKNGGDIRFQMRWDNLFKLYEEKAPHIPFDDGGLQDIPSDYTGWIRPTPFHSIYIERGIVKPYKELFQKQEEKISKKKEKTRHIKSVPPAASSQSSDKRNEELFVSPEHSESREMNNSALAGKLRDFKMAEKQVMFCLKQAEFTEDVLKYFNEMPEGERKKVNNPAGFIYKLVKDGFKAPEGFESVKDVTEKKEKMERIEEFGAKIRKAFYDGNVKYFCPEEGLKYPLSVVPDNVNFLYYKNGSKTPAGGRFCEWMDEKYFL